MLAARVVHITNKLVFIRRIIIVGIDLTDKPFHLEAVRPSGQVACLEIRGSWVQDTFSRRTIYFRLQIYFNETNILNKLGRFTIGETKS